MASETKMSNTAGPPTVFPALRRRPWFILVASAELCQV